MIILFRQKTFDAQRDLLLYLPTKIYSNTLKIFLHFPPSQEDTDISVVDITETSPYKRDPQIST